MTRFIPIMTRLVVMAVSLALLSGCAQYHAVDRDETVNIALAPIVNESDLAQIIAPLARNLREKINHTTGWRLVNEADADVLLSVRILGLHRDPIARDPDDTGRPVSYAEELRVALEWSSDLPPPWGEDPVTFINVDTLVYSQPSLVTSETAAVSEFAEELSRKIISSITWPRND